MKKTRERRISFNETAAEHIYEWLRVFWQDDVQRFGGCIECEQLGQRLERFIGPSSVRRLSALLRRQRIQRHQGTGRPRTITEAPRRRVERLSPQVNAVLKALGHPEALVTDESRVEDFSDFASGFSDPELTRVSRRLGVPVKNGVSIADVASRLKRR